MRAGEVEQDGKQRVGFSCFDSAVAFIQRSNVQELENDICRMSMVRG
jgi:hypothetical protein